MTLVAPHVRRSKGRRWRFRWSLVRISSCLALVTLAGAQTRDFCSSVTIAPDPLLIPAEGGVFSHSITTETTPFCGCRWNSSGPTLPVESVDGGPGFPVRTGRTEENPTECVSTFTWRYLPNPGTTRRGIFGVFTDQAPGRPVDFSKAFKTIEVIQEGAMGGGGESGANSSLSAIFARDDFVVAYRDTALDYPLLVNDAAAAGLDRSSVRINKQGEMGTAAASADGMVSYTPLAGAIGEDRFTYTVMDVNGVESNQATVTVDSKDEPPFTGCVFARPNQHLHFHHPALYLPLVQRIFANRPLEMGVRVLQNGRSAGEGIAVQISASRPVFPGDSGLPTFTVANGQTKSDGSAAFEINPPKPAPSDRIDLTANITIDGIDYSCASTLVVGLGSRLLPYVDALDGLADSAAQP